MERGRGRGFWGLPRSERRLGGEVFTPCNPNKPLSSLLPNEPTMRPLLTLLFIALFAGLSAQNWGSRNRVKGNGDMTTQDRKVSDFNGITTCCSFKVEVSKGAPAVRVEAESNLMEYIVTDVSAGRLSVRFKSGTSISNHDPIRVYVTMNELELVEASSSSAITFNDSFRGDELEVDVSSSARVQNLEFSGGAIRLEASSSGKINISGSGSKIRAKASSSGKISASDCKVQNARADVSSGGGIYLNVSGELNADASSGGSIRYTGGASVDSDTSSGGSVRNQ